MPQLWAAVGKVDHRRCSGLFARQPCLSQHVDPERNVCPRRASPEQAFSGTATEVHSYKRPQSSSRVADLLLRLTSIGVAGAHAGASCVAWCGTKYRTDDEPPAVPTRGGMSVLVGSIPCWQEASARLSSRALGHDRVMLLEVPPLLCCVQQGCKMGSGMLSAGGNAP